MEKEDFQNMRRLKTISSSVSEASRIKIDDIIKRFQLDCEVTDFTFPPLLNNYERAYVHSQCGNLGFKSQSTGVGEDRRITISKAKETNQKAVKKLNLSPRSVAAVQAIISSYPMEAEQDFDRCTLKPTGAQSLLIDESVMSSYTNRLSNGPYPKVPRHRSTRQYDDVRHKLPIWNHQHEILQKIQEHKVVFIKGDTGCGKTTQVPQFILDDATAKRKRVRILCTVPRRIAAVSISDRVATERGERVGFTVGYQIRLESCFSPVDTLLTYCTSGVLLRSLTSFDYSILRNATHIIIDEIHERDRQTDFLLACLRDVGLHFPNLKLILMGADMDNQLLTTYFGGPKNCPIIEVRGQLFPVKILFLEEILDVLDYRNYEMDRDGSDRKNNRSKANVVQGLVNQFKSTNLSVVPERHENEDHDLREDRETSITKITSKEDRERNAKLYDVDRMIKEVWSHGNEESFCEFIDLAAKKLISIDYQHSERDVTMLMATAVRGWTEHVSTLLDLGADSSIRALIPTHGRYFSAKDWAADYGHSEVISLLTTNEYTSGLKVNDKSMFVTDSTVEERLKRYQLSISDDRVDLQLIVKLLYKIHTCTEMTHAVLVFLPGYDEIVNLKQMLFTESEMRNFSNSFVLFLLHSNIQTGDQRAAFEKPRRGVRKILLSTNIAETSLTIEDVVYVIDSGKVKEKSFDSMTGVSQLKSNWISKASANQRQGRAGRCRPGICYRLYSSSRYSFMASFPTPEIVRSSLQELCLYTRSFIRGDIQIADFFARLPEPPAPIAVKKAVDMLMGMGAIDDKEQLTKLGLYLLDLPVEPALGKALMYAIVLKCLDPVLTIISVVSYRDPFQLPANPEDKKKALDSKLKFAQEGMSDHIASLKAFQDWEKSKLFRENTEKQFCRDHYLSSACFEMVYGIRAQLLGQLRASGFIRTKGPGDLRDLNENSDNWALVKGVLAATLYPNVCAIDKEKKCLYNAFENKIGLHPSSTIAMKRKNGLASIPTNWVLYDEICQQGNVRSVRGCTCVGDLALSIFAGNFSITPEPYNDGLLQSVLSENENVEVANLHPMLRFNINHWISFRGSKSTVELVLHLRERLQDLIYKRLKSPSHFNSVKDESILKTIVLTLVYEDEELGLKNVNGIGQWPKLVSGNMMSAPRSGFGQSQAAAANSGI